MEREENQISLTEALKGKMWKGKYDVTAGTKKINVIRHTTSGICKYLWRLMLKVQCGALIGTSSKRTKNYVRHYLSTHPFLKCPYRKKSNDMNSWCACAWRDMTSERFECYRLERCSNTAVGIPFCIADRCGHGCQAQKFYCKFKLKLCLEHSRFISFFFFF